MGNNNNAELDIKKWHKGAISELEVCKDLMKKGYNVFRALSQSSKFDAIAVKGSRILKLEVRTGNYSKRKNGNLSLGYYKEKNSNKHMVVYTYSDNKIHYINFEP